MRAPALRPILILLLAISRSPGMAIGGTEETNVPPALEIRGIRHAETAIHVRQERDWVVLDVTCPQGIDRAVVRRPAAGWPERIKVRLRLRGLESFEVAVGPRTIQWVVPSSGDGAPRVTLRDPTVSERLLRADHPFYSQVKIVRTASWHAEESAVEFFEVPLPARLWSENPPEITLRWIDFYRG